MSTPIPVPFINGVRHSFVSIELKMSGQIYSGFKSINYSRTRTRTTVMGNHSDPLGKTRGTNEYKADCELYVAEWNHFVMTVLQGQGYGDQPFTVVVTYGESGFDPIVDELQGCTLDSTDASNSQGSDPTVRKSDLNPLKILFNGVDDLLKPLAPPPGT